MRQEYGRQGVRRDDQDVRLLSIERSVPTVLERRADLCGHEHRRHRLEGRVHTLRLLQCIVAVQPDGCVPRCVRTGSVSFHPNVWKRSSNPRAAFTSHLGGRSPGQARRQSGREGLELDVRAVRVHDAHPVQLHPPRVHRRRNRREPQEGMPADARHAAEGVWRVRGELWRRGDRDAGPRVRRVEPVSQAEPVHEHDEGERLALDQSECRCLRRVRLCVDVCELRHETRLEREVVGSSFVERVWPLVVGTTIAMRDDRGSVRATHSRTADESW